MKQIYKHQVITFALLIIAFGVSVYEVSKMVARERVEDLSTALTVEIAKQQALPTTIAEPTARNGADAVTESIIKDCTTEERTEFDALLSRLDASLTQSELVKLERLFGRCGAFYAERKAVMVARLEREVVVFSEAVSQLELVTGQESDEYRIGTWNSLVEQEKIQSDQFNTLVTLQDNIIAALLDGKSAKSPEVKEILKKAQETQQSLVTASRQSTGLRTALTAL